MRVQPRRQRRKAHVVRGAPYSSVRPARDDGGRIRNRRGRSSRHSSARACERGRLFNAIEGEHVFRVGDEDFCRWFGRTRLRTAACAARAPTHGAKTGRFLTDALAFWIRRVLPRTLQGAKCRRSGAGDERARFEEIRITRLKRAGSMRPCRSRRRRTVFALEPLGEIGEHWPRLVGPYQLGPGRWRLKRARGRVSWSSLAPSRLEAPASEEPEQREHHDYDQDDH